VSDNNYTRRSFLKVIGLGATVFIVQNPTNPTKLLANSNIDEKPNIIFILVERIPSIIQSIILLS